LINIYLSQYSRVDLSNLLQIAQQCDNAGSPLPCWLVEQVTEEHDARLMRDDTVPRRSRCEIHNQALIKAECGRLICLDCYDEENRP
jgi:hypothetical protein